MSGLIQAGWVSPAGVLFPLASYRPEQNLAYDAHKAGWEHVFRGEKPAATPPLNPAALAEARKFGAGLCDESLEQPSEVL